MLKVVSLDEADLVMAAAVAWRADPDSVLRDCDLPALVSVAGEAATALSAVDAAAIIVAGLARRRPFRDAGNGSAAAWLAALDVLARAGLELPSSPRAAPEIVRRMEAAGSDVGAVREVLAGLVRRRPPAWRRTLRRAVRRAVQPREVPLRQATCPACKRAVRLSPQDANALTWLGAVAGEPFLTARCGCQRATTDGHLSGSAPRLAAGEAVPVVDAPHGPVNAFLALTPAGAVAFVPASGACGDGDGASYELALIGDPQPSDLVGDWTRLLQASEERTVVAAAAVRRDAQAGWLDVDHLLAVAPHTAPMMSPRQPAAVG